eukprot:c12779_g1_i1.p1 GENE.c12779_g1_i1~~c12779_g1_i1.p1  ORF type:complete len:220 (+),score=75.96 c12779_g1_i1:41-661(+)
MLSRVCRSAVLARRVAPFPVSVRFISSEKFQEMSGSSARYHAEQLAKYKVPEPTQAQIEASEKLVEAMKTAADRPAKSRMVGVMDAAIAAGNIDYAFLAIQEINKRGFQQDPVTLKRLVAAACNAGEVDRAYQLVDSFTNFGVLADSEALAILTEGYLKIGEPFKAYQVFSCWNNVDDATTPSEALVNSLKDSLTKAGFVDEAAAV